MTLNPLVYVLLIFVAMTSMKMVYKGENDIEQMQRIQRICATLPTQHPDCNK